MEGSSAAMKKEIRGEEWEYIGSKGREMRGIYYR
jgi:hypothetical protein